MRPSDFVRFRRWGVELKLEPINITFQTLAAQMVKTTVIHLRVPDRVSPVTPSAQPYCVCLSAKLILMEGRNLDTVSEFEDADNESDSRKRRGTSEGLKESPKKRLKLS